MWIYRGISVLAGKLNSLALAILCLSFSSPTLADKSASEPFRIHAMFGGIEVSLPIVSGVGVKLPEKEIFFTGGLEDIRRAYSTLEFELARHDGVLPVVGYGFNPKKMCELAKFPECKVFGSDSTVSIAYFKYSLLRPELKYSSIENYASFCGRNTKWIAIEGISMPKVPEKYIVPGTMTAVYLMIDDTILVRVLASNYYGQFKGAETAIVAKNAAEFASCILFPNSRI